MKSRRMMRISLFLTAILGVAVAPDALAAGKDE
jgi:hypothetical protein